MRSIWLYVENSFLYVIYDQLSHFQCISIISEQIYDSIRDNGDELHNCDAFGERIYGKFNCWQTICKNQSFLYSNASKQLHKNWFKCRWQLNCPSLFCLSVHWWHDWRVSSLCIHSLIFIYAAHDINSKFVIICYASVDFYR